MCIDVDSDVIFQNSSLMSEGGRRSDGERRCAVKKGLEGTGCHAADKFTERRGGTIVSTIKIAASRPN